LKYVKFYDGFLNASATFLEPNIENVVHTDLIKFSVNDLAILYTNKSYNSQEGFHIYFYDENKIFIRRDAIIGVQSGAPLNLGNWCITNNIDFNFSYIRLAYGINRELKLFIYKFDFSLYPNILEKKNYAKEDILIDKFDPYSYIPGYYNNLPDSKANDRVSAYVNDIIEFYIDTMCTSSHNDIWISSKKPMYELYPGEIGVIKALEPVFLYGYIGNTFISPNNMSENTVTGLGYALEQNENNEIIIKNNYSSGILKVYISFNFHFAGYNYGFYNYYTNNKTLIIPEINKCNRCIYEVLNNALDRDLSQFNENFFISNKHTENYNRFLTNIYITTNTARSCTIAIGLHDQRDWFVVSNTYTINLNKGKNYIDTRCYNIIIPSGYQLAYQIAAGDDYINFNGNSAGDYITERFASLSNINITPTGNTIIPLFEYDAEPLASMSSVPSNNISTNNNQNTIYYTPNGDRYRLQLDSNANIIKTRVTPLKYMAIGNSITSHDIRESVGWYASGRSMAASKAEYDYVHRLVAYFQTQGSNSIEFSQWNYATWETTANARNTTYSTLDSHLSSDLDLITIQLGENVSDTTTLQEDYIDLIKHIKTACQKAFIIMIGDCFASQTKDQMKKYACKVTGIPFVDLSMYNTLSAFKSYIGAVCYADDGSTFTVTNDGVANHPGDNGFKIMAEEILRIIYNDNTITL